MAWATSNPGASVTELCHESLRPRQGAREIASVRLRQRSESTPAVVPGLLRVPGIQCRPLADACGSRPSESLGTGAAQAAQTAKPRGRLEGVRVRVIIRGSHNLMSRRLKGSAIMFCITGKCRRLFYTVQSRRTCDNISWALPGWAGPEARALNHK